MTSPEKIAANRNNAKKSTGPKTVEGKAKSARNAVTHGLTADPGEPTEAYQEYLREWIADLKYKSVAHRTLAEQACRAAWDLRRCHRFQDATAAKRDRDSAELFDVAEAERAEAIGRRLLAKPDEVVYDDGSRAIATGYARPGDDDPAALVAELRRTAAGVDWLLARWAELGRALKDANGWNDDRRFAAIRLLGLRPESAGDHPLVWRIVPLNYDIAHPPGGHSWLGHPAMEGALEACVAASERGEGSTVELWTACLRAVACHARGEVKSAAGDANLRALVRSERAKLSRLKARLKGRAAEDRAGAADRALFDDARALALFLRYTTAASRDLHRSITDLAKLRKAAEDEGEGPTEPPPKPRPGPGARPAGFDPSHPTSGPRPGGGAAAPKPVAPGPESDESSPGRTASKLVE